MRIYPEKVTVNSPERSAIGMPSASCDEIVVMRTLCVATSVRTRNIFIRPNVAKGVIESFKTLLKSYGLQMLAWHVTDVTPS